MIKKYLDFIKESIKEQIEEKTLWKLTEDDITDYMLEITDAGYFVSVQFGFSEKVKRGNYKNGEWVETEKDVFTDKVKAGDKVIPSYWISINKGDRIKNDDVTSTFQFACSIIAEEANAEVSIHDAGGNIGDIDGVEIKGGLFFTDTWSSDEGDRGLMEAEDYIAIFAKSKETVEFTEEDLVKYYNWSDAIIKEGKVYVEVNLEDMSDIMLSRNSSYKDILVKGEENMYDNYYGSDYQPDIPSMIQYTLNNENNHLLIKAMIKEMGGLENLISENEDLEGKTEEEIIEFLLKERFYETLKKLCKESEICQEVRQTIGDWEMNAHVDSNYQEILNEFDEIVEKEFTYTKEKREVTKYYTTKDADGNQTRKEYQELDTFYTIPYSNDWINNEDVDRLKDSSLFDIFKDWCGEQYFTYEMKPYFSDSGDVDSKALNQEIKGDLERYLK